MGLLEKLKSGLRKTQEKLLHELKRIVAGVPKADPATLEELETILLGADFGVHVTNQIVQAVKSEFEEGEGRHASIIEIAKREIEKILLSNEKNWGRNGQLFGPGLYRAVNGPTIVLLVGVNGTGKTTTAAKLAWMIKQSGETAILAACDTFRAAAIEQLKTWAQRVGVDIVSASYGTDPAAVAHDAVMAAKKRNISYVIIDTAGRLHTKHNLMQELQKIRRVVSRQIPDAPHETLLVLDATTGTNALNQAREFNKAVPLTGLVITKLDGTSKGGIVVAIKKELGIPIRFVGVGEQMDDLQPFDAKQFVTALFNE